MAILDIEINDLSALAEHNPNKNYVGFLGIGKAKKQAKKIVASVSTSEGANEDFRNRMVQVYQNVFKGASSLKNEAINNINKPNGVEVVYQATERFGVPSNKSQLEAHNVYVGYLSKYFVPIVPSTIQDCENLLIILEDIQAEVDAKNKMAAAGNRTAITQASLVVLADRESEVKKVIAKSQCEKKIEEEAKTQSREETLSTLKQATTTPPSTSDNTTKYIAYGVGGLVIVIALIMLTKKNG